MWCGCDAILLFGAMLTRSSTWATGRQVKDGLEMVNAEGQTWTVRAVGMRDQLFNRLCAMGGQRWVID